MARHLVTWNDQKGEPIGLDERFDKKSKEIREKAYWKRGQTIKHRRGKK